MNFLSNTGLEYFYNKLKEKFIRSVNSQIPDADGNVTITNVAAADNLISPDAQTSYDTFTYRTSGGNASISNGEAQLIYIDGNIDIIGRVYENFSINVGNNVVITYNASTWRTQIDESGEYVFNYTKPASSVAVSSWSPSLGVWTYNNSIVSLNTYGLESSNIFAPNISIVINGSNIRNPQIVPNTWMDIIESSGNYDFIYNGNSWTFDNATIDLLTYGITISGTPEEGDIITISYYAGTPDTTLVINYTAPEQGTILVAKPTAFSSTGFNQFDSESMYIQNASIVNGVIASNSGTYIAYCHAKGGVTNGYVAYSENAYIRNIGWCETLPTIGTSVITTGSSVSNTLASIPFEEDGYVVVVTTDISDLCIHPKWSGSADTEYQAYTAPSVINLPTTAIDSAIIPLGTYGMPAVGQVADRLNLDAGVYIQNIGRYDYSLGNLETVQALGVDYDYDDTNIFYVLNNPVSYNVSVDQIYIVNDFGTEEFLNTPVSVKAYMLYGQNLRDKLRTDVLTISQQTPPLSQNQRQQVLSNIGISNISNPNLLDNWYFVGGGSQLGEGIFPINQLGKTSYSGGMPAIDRWKSDVVMTIQASGIKLSTASQLYQNRDANFYKKLIGKTITISAIIDGVLHSGSITCPAVSSTTTVYDTNDSQIKMAVYNDGKVQIARIVADANSVISAAKAEIGSTQTLAHQENGIWVLNEIPNWEEENYKCHSGIKIQSLNMNSTVTPSAGITGQALSFNDINNTPIAQIYPGRTTAGQNCLALRSYLTVNGEQKSNYLLLNVNANGAASVIVSDPAAWVSGLNVLSRSGGTLSGNLVISNTSPGIYLNNSNYDVTASSYTASNSVGLRLRDKNNKNVAIITDRYLADGKTGLWLSGWKTVNGSDIGNSLYLFVNKYGERVVEVSEGAPWRKAINLCYAANDTMVISSSIAIPGVINGSALTIYFDFYTDKSMENISTITVTTMTGYIVGSQGAVNGSANNTNYIASPYTITTLKQSSYHVRIGLTKSSAYTNVVGNTPVNYFGSLTLKFT